MAPDGKSARRAKHTRIRARIVALNAEVIRSWSHLTAEQRVEAERLLAVADVSALSDYMKAHQPLPQ